MPGRSDSSQARAAGNLRGIRALGATAGLLGALLWAGPARGAAEGEWEILGAAGASQLRVDRRWALGAQLGAEVQRGLTDLWSLRLGLGGSWHSVDAAGTGPGGRIRTLAASLGVVYALDIFRVVPFAELSLNLTDLAQAVRWPGTYLGPQLGAGASYYLDPRWSLSGVLRANPFGVALTGGQAFDSAPVMLTASLRLCRQL